MAHVLKLNLLVVFICALLPDLVDKPLWALGIGAPRYVAHTVLFMLVVAVALFLWRRAYGLAALLGGGSHLFLDWVVPGARIPWFYPFVSYSFPERDVDPSAFFPNLFESIETYFLLDIGRQLIWVAAVCAAVLLVLRLRQAYLGARKRRGRSGPPGQPKDAAR